MKDTKYYQMFADAWRFMGDHYPPEKSDAYLDKLLDDGDAIARKHDSKFMNALLVAVMRELESL